MTAFTLYFCDKSGNPLRPLTHFKSNIGCDFSSLADAIAARDFAYDRHDAKQRGERLPARHSSVSAPPTPRGRIAIMKIESNFKPAERVA